MKQLILPRLFRKPLRAMTAVSIALLAYPAGALRAEPIQFKAMMDRGGYLDTEAPARWRDPDTDVSVFNAKYQDEGITQGPDRLPGELTFNLPTSGSKIKVMLAFSTGTRGVAALTLTSTNGKQRLRFQQDSKGLTLSWRDYTVEEEPKPVRSLKTTPSADRRELVLIIDPVGGTIEVNDGFVSETLAPGMDGVPEFFASALVKLIASVQTDAILYEVNIEEM